MLKTEYVDNFLAFYRDYKEHIEKHYNDFAETFGGDRVLDIDVNLYQQLIDLGSANIFTLWDEEVFIGYVSITINPSILFKGKVDAVIDHFYLTTEARGKGYSKLVLDEIEDQLKSDGLDRYSIALPAVETYEKFADAAGFRKQSVISFKNLGD
jgi:GNAT superfamily N-acetyltransferase